MATIASTNSGYYLNANNMAYRAEYTHNSAVDGSTRYGGMYGFPRRPVVGGAYYEPSCGSRGAYVQISTAYAHYSDS